MKRVIALLLLFCSCGYRFGEGGCLAQYGTVEVPYVQCDCSGLVTQALAKELTVRGPWQVCSRGGDLLLKVSIVQKERDNIGFQYDTNGEGECTRRTVANEGRLSWTVEVCAIERCSGRVVLGPATLCAYADYDFNPLSTDSTVTRSLGQFVEIDEAEEAAQSPLAYALARQVVDFLLAAW